MASGDFQCGDEAVVEGEDERANVDEGEQFDGHDCAHAHVHVHAHVLDYVHDHALEHGHQD